MEKPEQGISEEYLKNLNFDSELPRYFERNKKKE